MFGKATSFVEVLALKRGTLSSINARPSTAFLQYVLLSSGRHPPRISFVMSGCECPLSVRELWSDGQTNGLVVMLGVQRQIQLPCGLCGAAKGRYCMNQPAVGDSNSVC